MNHSLLNCPKYVRQTNIRPVKIIRTGLTKYGFQMIFLILEDLRDFKHTVYIMESVIVLLFCTNSIIL